MQKLANFPFLTTNGKELLRSSLSAEDRERLSSLAGLQELDLLYLNGEAARDTGVYW